MATELAKAYVQIIPTAQGIKGQLSEMLGGEAEQAGKSAGEKAGGTFGSAFKGLAIAGVAAIGAATTAAVGFAKSAVDVGQSFDAAMSQVAAVSGATGEDFDALREKAQEMGASTKFSASEAADAMNYMAMAGWKTEEMLGGIEGIMNLAAASGESLGATSDIVTDALTAFGMTAQDSGRFADVLAAASSNANTNVAMMGETFKYVAPLAGALQFSAEDTATAIGLMANAGIKGSQAGTALRSILTRLAKPTKESAAAMNMLGVSLEDEYGNTRSLAEVMDLLRDGFGNLAITEENYQSVMTTLNKQLEEGIITQADYNEQAALWEVRAHGSTEAMQAQFAAMLGGQEALSGLLAIVNAAPGDYEKLTTAIYESDGAAAKMAATMQDNLAGDLTIMQSTLEGAKIAVSDQLTPALREFVQFATSGISELTTAFQEGGLSGAMDALGGILSDGLAKITEMLPSFVEAGLALLSALGQGIMDNLPHLVYTALEIISILVKSIAEAAPELAEAAIEVVDELAYYLGMYADELIEAAVTIISTLFEALTSQDSIETLAYAAIYLITCLAEAIVENIPELLDTAIEIIDNLVDFLIDNVGELIDAAVEIILTLAEGVIENLPKLIEKAPEIIAKLVDAIIENVPKLIDASIEIIVKLAEGIIQNLPQLLESATQIVFTIAEGIVKMLGELVKKGKEIVDSVKEGFSQKLEDAKNWGRDLIGNFISGIKEKWENLKSTVSNVAGTVKSFLGFSEPELGPLSDFSTYAPDMMKLYAEGISKNRGLVLTEAERLAGDLNGVLTSRGPQLAYAGLPSGPAYGGAGDMRSIQQEIRDTLEALRGMQVVVNGNALVGVLTAPLNRSLGEQYDYNRRGI